MKMAVRPGVRVPSATRVASGTTTIGMTTPAVAAAVAVASPSAGSRGRSSGRAPALTLLTRVAAKATWVSISSATWVARRSGVGVAGGRAVGVAVAVGPKANPLRAAAPISATPSRIKTDARTLIVMTSAARLAGCGCGAGIMGMAGWRQLGLRSPGYCSNSPCIWTISFAFCCPCNHNGRCNHPEVRVGAAGRRNKSMEAWCESRRQGCGQSG